MDKLYKVFYLEMEHSNHGMIKDGLETSKHLEALLLEQVAEGYVLESIVPIEGNNVSNLTGTVGLIVTVKKQTLKHSM